MEWVRKDQGSAPDAALLAVSLVLIRLPVALGTPYAWPVRLAVLIPFAWSILRNLARIARGRAAGVDGRLMLLLAAYVMVVCMSYARAVLDERLPVAVTLDGWLVFLAVAIAVALAFIAAPSARDQERLRLAVAAGLAIYVAVNLALQLAGFRHLEVVYQREFPASMLGLLGIRTSAAFFPMAGGVNAFGTIGGALLAASGAMLARRVRGSLAVCAAAIGMALGLVTVMWTDARLSLLFGLLAILLMAAAGTHRLPALRWLVLLPILFPLLLLACLSAIPPAWWDAIGEGARHLASLSNREAIWRAVLAHLLAFSPAHLIGYGAFGQLASGLSAEYAQHFTAYVHPELASAHNAFLQAVIEIGYIGAAVTLALAGLAMRRLATAAGPRREHLGATAMTGLLCFTALVGCVEAAWSPEYQEVQVVLLATLAGAAVFDRRDLGASRA